VSWVRERFRAPWWFCNGWWSPWCIIDTIAHAWFHLSMPVDDLDNPAHSDHWICRKHDAAIEQKGGAS